MRKPYSGRLAVQTAAGGSCQWGRNNNQILRQKYTTKADITLASFAVVQNLVFSFHLWELWRKAPPPIRQPYRCLQLQVSPAFLLSHVLTS